MRWQGMAAAAVTAVVMTACAANPGADWDDPDMQWSEDDYVVWATDAGYYGDWDLDDDGRLSEMELETAYSGAGVAASYGWDEWDMNDDTYLDENELHRGTFAVLDTNDDGYLSQMELRAGLR